MRAVLAVAAVISAAGVMPDAAGARPTRFSREHGGCHSWRCVARVRAKRWPREQRRLSPSTRAMLRRLRGCETRGLAYPANYRYEGAHDGAYQYDEATWHQAGGSGRAFQASPAEQDVRTARFYPGHRGQWACRA